jgi:hypothetical protein
LPKPWSTSPALHHEAGILRSRSRRQSYLIRRKACATGSLRFAGASS